MTPNWYKLLPDGRHALYLDNTLLTAFIECPRKFYYRHVLNIIPKGDGEVSAPMWLGQWWSKTMEFHYQDMKDYQDKIEGSVEPSEKSIVACAAEAWQECKMYDFAATYPHVYDKFGGTTGAVRMAYEYWKYYGEFDAKHWKIIASELAFGREGEVLVDEDEELVLYWCGKPDLIPYEDQLDNLFPVDHKTKETLKSNFVEIWKPHNQMCGYILALNKLSKELGIKQTVDRCVVNGAAWYRVKTNPEKQKLFERVRPHYNPDEIAEWQVETFDWAKLLLHSYLANTWNKTKTVTTCHLYGGCRYRGIDNQPPGYARNTIIETSYVKIEPWIPYQKLEEEEEVA